MKSSTTTAIFTLAALASSALAQLTIISPSSSLWWVDDEENDITWTCDTSPYENFTILLYNTNTSILDAPYAFVAEQQNYDCSETIYPTQLAKFPAADNYTIQFANIENSSDIYAESEPFTIEPEGSAYPSSSATPTGTATATSSSASASASATATSKSGAGSVRAAAGGVALVAAVVGMALL